MSEVEEAPRPLRVELDCLGKSVDELEGTVTELEKRLAGLLLPASVPHDKAEEKPTGAVFTIGVDIRDCRERIKRSREVIVEILDRLAI